MGYHGIAMGALAATGIPTYYEGFGPRVPGYVHLTAPYDYRNGERHERRRVRRHAASASWRRRSRAKARSTIAAMIGEPVQGAGGVVVPPDGYWPAMAECCDKHGILLIADEVICGFGRTGTMFGVQHYGVDAGHRLVRQGHHLRLHPARRCRRQRRDLRDMLSTPDRMFMHGFTYSGHPVACAVGTAEPRRSSRTRTLPENAGRDGRLSPGGAARPAGRPPQRRQCPGQGTDVLRRVRRGQGDEGEVRSHAEHRGTG